MHADMNDLQSIYAVYPAMHDVISASRSAIFDPSHVDVTPKEERATSFEYIWRDGYSLAVFTITSTIHDVLVQDSAQRPTLYSQNLLKLTCGSSKHVQRCASPSRIAVDTTRSNFIPESLPGRLSSEMDIAMIMGAGKLKSRENCTSIYPVEKATWSMSLQLRVISVYGKSK